MAQCCPSGTLGARIFNHLFFNIFVGICSSQTECSCKWLLGGDFWVGGQNVRETLISENKVMNLCRPEGGNVSLTLGWWNAQFFLPSFPWFGGSIPISQLLVVRSGTWWMVLGPTNSQILSPLPSMQWNSVRGCGLSESRICRFGRFEGVLSPGSFWRVPELRPGSRQSLQC